jgi:hypothetical protein
MQRAALELARGATCEDVGRLLGVSGESIRQWTKRADWGQYAAVARELAQSEAAASARNNIIQLRPNAQQSPPPIDDTETVTTPETLVDQALNALAVAVRTGNVQAATWVLERIDPARFGTPKDRLAMAELQKAATDIVPRKVTVTITAPPKRKAASGA